MALRLIIEDEEGATTIVPLSEEEITIGREAGNTIQLTEQNVSRQHARLTLGADGWMLEDLDSYNGIKVNNVSVEGQVNLQEGDRVQIGDYHLTLVDNVDASTLNLGKQAANDNSASASMKAAPSVDLPALAPEQVAALSQPAANLAAVPTPLDDEDDEPASGGGGKAIVIVLLLAVVAVGAYFAMAGGDTPKPDQPSTDKNVASASAGPEAKTSAGPADSKKTPDAKQVTPSASAGETAGAAPDSGADDSAGDSDDSAGDPTDSGADDSGADDSGADDSGADDSGADDSAGATDTKQPVKKKKKKVKKPPKQETPPKPAGDPNELLQKARAASLSGNSSEAYRLAKDSYSIDRNAKALKLMGVSACKMGDEGKAKSVYKKVSATTKNQLSQLCKLKGIDLGG